MKKSVLFAVVAVLAATHAVAQPVQPGSAQVEPFHYDRVTHNGAEYLVIEFDHGNSSPTLAGAVRNWESNPPHHNYSKGKSLGLCHKEWQISNLVSSRSRYTCAVMSRTAVTN